MVDLEDIKQAATVETDTQGRAVVRIPRELWEEWVIQGLRPQNEWLLTLLNERDTQHDNRLDEWWDEF